MTAPTLAARVRERIERHDAYGYDAATVNLLREAADTLEARAKWIEPLRKHDDPELAEVVRMTPDYVLYDRQAADREAEMHHGWRTKWKAAEAEPAEARQALEAADARFKDAWGVLTQVATALRVDGYDDHDWDRNDLLG